MRNAILCLLLFLPACQSSEDTPVDIDADGYTVEDGDCDDFDRSIHPDADEVCNLLDDDCNGETDEGLRFYADLQLDADGDNYPDPNAPILEDACLTLVGYGSVGANEDCDDSDPTVYIGAEDPVGDGIDQNCDGVDGGF